MPMHAQPASNSLSGSTSHRFSISETACLIGVSAGTLRAWEREGLLRPVRTAAGYRRYSRDNVDRLPQIHRLRDVQGLSLQAIQRTLGAPPADGPLPSIHRARMSD